MYAFINNPPNGQCKKSVFLNERFLKHFSVSFSFRLMGKKHFAIFTV